MGKKGSVLNALAVFVSTVFYYTLFLFTYDYYSTTGTVVNLDEIMCDNKYTHYSYDQFHSHTPAAGSSKEAAQPPIQVPHGPTPGV